jgi:autotransporter-associated beta strand protein
MATPVRTVNQGKLILAYGNNSGQALATDSSIIIHNGGTLETTGINNINSNVFTVNAGGTLAMGAGKTSWIQGSLTLNGGTLASSDGGFGGATFVLNPSSNQVSVTGDDTSTISAQNVLMAPNASLTFDVADGASAIDLNVTGTLGNNGTSGLVKSGPGTMVLAGGNTYTGDTTVNMGTLALVGGSQSSAITVGSGASLGFTLGSATTSSSSFNLTDGTVKITGTPTLPAYTLITSSTGITGTPTLDAPISGYALAVEGGTSLKLVQTGGYSSWMAPFITGGLTGDTTPAGDPENDGMTNLLEYALNGNPSVADPSIQPDPVVTATDFEFTYSRLDLSLADTTQTFEYGSNLSGWTPVLIPAGPGVEIPVGAAKVTIINTGTTDDVTISIPKSVSPSGKLFGRLKVVK